MPWYSRWINIKNYNTYLKEDYQVRNFIIKKLGRSAAIDHIDIERSHNMINIIIHTARPGLIIGRGGTGIEELKKLIDSEIFKGKHEKGIRVEIQEIRHPTTYARLVAIGIAEQLERRRRFRSVIKQVIAKIIENKEVLGAKILVKGRLDGKEMGRTEWVADGQMPLNNLRAVIDYAHENAYTTWGVIGVKVWIYKGEVFE